MEQRAINHMNEEHSEIVAAFCKKFGSFKNPTNIKLTAINQDGMEITCDQGSLFVPFLQKANLNGEGYKDAIIALYKSIDASGELEAIELKMNEFIDGLKSVIISSVHCDMQCVGSYAPFVRDGDDVFICLSSVAEHFDSIRANPNKISLLFLEDEKDAKTIFARMRFSAKCSAEFVSGDLRERIFDIFENRYPKESAIKTIRRMSDFHIVKITINNGRFVKGFGAAYDSKGFKITKAAGVNNPHKNMK